LIAANRELGTIRCNNLNSVTQTNHQRKQTNGDEKNFLYFVVHRRSVKIVSLVVEAACKALFVLANFLQRMPTVARKQAVLRSLDKFIML